MAAMSFYRLNFDSLGAQTVTHFFKIGRSIMFHFEMKIH
jgi:hypothetical protein